MTIRDGQELSRNKMSQYKTLQGFSLVELSLTIAIVAGLAAVAIVIMNPAELSAQMRDGQRLAAMGDLREVVGVLVAENPNLPTGFGATNLAYISLPDTHSDCRNITNLPVRTDGRIYHCVTAANLRNIDGTGWMPVDFTAIRRGSPISVLPVDPTNNFSFFYEYLPADHHRYTFSARVESIRHRAQGTIFTTRFAAPFNFNLSASPSSGSVIQGESVSTTITTYLISGVTREVSFSASGLPSGVTAIFSPANCNPFCNSTLNIVANATTPTGTYNITIIATGAGITRSMTYVMSVAEMPPPLLSVTAFGTGTVTSSPAGINCGADCTETYTPGTSVVLTATPGANQSFGGWSGACIGTGTCTVSMTQARSVTATFNQITHNLAVTIVGTGTVASSPAGINCTTGTCNLAFNQGTSVVLTATPGANQSFGGWSGACIGTGTCTASMTQARSVTATFNQITHTLTVNSLGATGVATTGTHAGTTNYTRTVAQGATITITAPATSGGQNFANWAGCDSITTVTTCNLTMNAARTVTANYVPPAPTASCVVASSTQVNVSWTNVAGETGFTVYRCTTAGCTPTTPTIHTAGVDVLTWSNTGLTASTMYRYRVRASNAGGSSPFSNVVECTTSAVTFTLTTSVSGIGTITSSPAGINCGADCTEAYASGTSVILTATPGANQSFGGWSGACTGTGTCTVSMTQARSVTATFNQITHTLSVTISGTGTVTSSPAGINCTTGTCSAVFAQGTSVTLTAFPGIEQRFDGWSGACTGTSTCTLTMNSSQSVTAFFSSDLIL